MIANAAYDETEKAYVVNLDKNVSGNVKAVFEKEGTLIINLANHKISGSFKLEASSASAIYINDAGSGSTGAVITGDFEVSAPKAHVENQASVNGTTKVYEVSDSTYCMFDQSAKFEVYGQGKIQFAANVVNPPQVDIKTDKKVVLAGGIEKVKVQENTAARLEIAEDTAIEEVVIPTGTETAEISGSGSVTTVQAAAPVTVKTAVSNIVVASDEAKITVDTSAKVSNVTVASEVKKVTVSGNVSAIDVSNASNEIVIAGDVTAKIVTKDEVQAKAIKENTENAAIAASIVYVTDLEVVYTENFTEKVTLRAGVALNLDGYQLKVKDSDGGETLITVTESMLTKPDYVLDSKGTVELKVSYAGKETTLAQITYLESDTVTLSCTVGEKKTYVNGDNEFFDGYTIGTEYLNDLEEVLETTSAYKQEIKFSYKGLHDSGNDWVDGVPTEAGDYVIRAYTVDSDECFGGYAYIWIYATADNDYIEFDESKLTEDQKKDVIVKKESDSDWAIASITFGEDAYSTEKLNSILTSAASTHNGGTIAYSWFANGAAGGEIHQGLPSIPGHYNIVLTGTDAWGHTSKARVWVYCADAKEAKVKVTISGGDLKVVTDASLSVNESYVSYVNCNSTVSEENSSVSLELRESCGDQYHIITIKEGTAYTIKLESNGKELPISNCMIGTVEAISVEKNRLSTSYVDAIKKVNAWPTEKGRYEIFVCVNENQDVGTCETWCKFNISIE